MINMYINNAIDSIQVSKKIMVDTFVKHEGLAKTLNGIVDTQTEYTKKAIDAGITASANVYKTLTDKSFYTETLKSMQDAAQAIFHTHQKGKENAD